MRNLFKSILRSFINKPVITLINVVGLSISLVLVIILSTYCYSELTTDTHHENGDRIYLIGKPGAGMHTPAILKENIDMKVPGVKSTVRIAGTWSEPVFQTENGYPIVSDLIFADPDFFNLFTYKVLEGNPGEVFKNPLSIAITETLKKKLFGDEKALGRTIKYNNNQILTISAIIEEPIRNTFLSFSAVTSIDTKQILQPNEGEMTNWGWSNFQTFLLLDRNVNIKEIASTILSLFPEDHQEWIGEINLISMDDIYSDDLSKDKDKVIVNETFLKRFDFEDPIGGTFGMGGGSHFEIVGVIKDFHFTSMEKKIEPLLIINGDYASYCLTNIQATDFGSLQSTMLEIKSIAAKLSPAFPVEVSFLDNAVNKMYEVEVRFRRTFSLFAISAIVICAIGILAMSIFASQRRTKEIGVRKVNGARLTEILAMLNSDFIKWVAVAFILACPISWFVMNKWLSGFAYKTDISWWIFALTGVIAMAIALFTVSWQSWRAASRNPVEALRYE